MERVGDLEIDQHLVFQHREWIGQRIGWVLMLAVVILSAVGVWGHGPASSTSVASGDGELRLEFPRFLHSGGQAELVVRADAALASEGSFELDVSTAYVHAFEIEVVNPTPQEVQAAGETLRYVFAQAEPSADLEVVFHTRPRDVGALEGDVHIEGRSVTISQFVYP